MKRLQALAISVFGMAVVSTGVSVVLETSLELPFVSSAEAQEKIRDTRTVVGSATPLTDTLGGRRVGELYLTAKVTVHEEKGDWVRVTSEGWVKSKDLSAPNPNAVMESSSSTPSASSTSPAPTKDAASAALATVQQDVLRVSDFITAHRTDIDPPRMYVTLTLKNLTDSKITTWSGTLVAQTEDGKVVFREPISQDGVSITGNSSTDASFYWEPHEEAYDRLLAVEKTKIKFSLAKVTAQ